MPIYMDRHDVSNNVTAEIVAQIHQEDLKIQDQYGCKGMTYWFDENRKMAFCLVEAPNIEAIHAMHHHAHGEVPNQVIEVNTALVESFLGRIEDPANNSDAELNIIVDSAHRTLIVMHIRQINPMRIISDKVKQSLKQFQGIVGEYINRYNGRIVKQNDNYYLVSFKSVSAAVHGARDLRKQFRERMAGEGLKEIQLKVGLSAGVPVTGKKNMFEDSIKLADRICKIVDSEMVLSAEVRELYNNENFTVLSQGEDIYCLNAAEEKFLNDLMDYTESNWMNAELSMDDLSRSLGYSSSQFYRRITSLTGKSPNNFFQEYRLNEALQLLKKNAGNISEIAFQTGFSSPSYFSRTFRKRYGLMPLEVLSAAE